MKPGYKQTEVGVIPEDWGIRPLLSTVRIANGQVSPKVEPYKSMVLVAPDHIESSTGKLLAKQTASEQGAISGKYFFESGDIVYSKIRPYLRKAILADFSGLCSADMYPLKPAADISAGYILAVILGYRFSKYAESVSVRSGMPKINRTEMADFSLGVPPPPEQRAIATALSDVDALLAALDRLIAKKRDLKQAAMQQLLTGQTRLPGFTGEWEENTIADLEKRKLVNLSRGQVISKKDIDHKPGDFPIYSSSIHNDGLFGRYGDFMFDEELITWSVDGGGNFFHRRKHKFSVTNVCGFMRVDTSRIDYRFFAAELQLLHSRKSFDYQSKAHPSVVRNEYEVQLPPLPEQTAIASVLSDMDAALTALEQRRHKTRALKQAMMQELLTGRTRLI
jgi:type I restriction enzyme S subunit